MVLRLKCYNVRIPLVIPFKTSFGTTEVRDALIFELSDGNNTAYSESVTSTSPDYGYEDNSTVLHVAKDFLAPMLADLPSPAEFMERASVIKGNNMAKASLEMLLWDFHSRAENKAIQDTMGENRGYASAGVSIGMSSTDRMLKLVEDGMKRGYKRIKVKIEKGKEMEILGSIRNKYPDIPLSTDANCSYSFEDIDLLKELDSFNLEYLEQPLGHDDLVDHAELAKSMKTPICLDESITSAEIAEKAFRIKACSIVNIKPGRVGGFTESLKIARSVRRSGGHVWIGGMLETGIGRAFNVALASNSLIDFPGDTSPNDRYFSRDIVSNPFTMENGTIRPNGTAGTGIQIDHSEFMKSVHSAYTLLEKE